MLPTMWNYFIDSCTIYPICIEIKKIIFIYIYLIIKKVNLHPL